MINCKIMDVDAKEMPKCNQSRCHNSSKTNAKTRSENDHENHQKSCSINRKLEFLVKAMFFAGFAGCAGCVRERKRYPKNIKNDIKIRTQNQ